MTAPPPAGGRSGTALAVTLFASTAVALLYAAAALAWRADYAPRLGPPLWAGSLLAARSALVVGLGLLAVLAVYGQRRAAGLVALAVVVGAPAALGPVYPPGAGFEWTVQLAKAGHLEGPVGHLALGLGAVGGALALAVLTVLSAPLKPEPSPAHGTARWGDGAALLEPERGLVLGRQGDRVPEVGHAVEETARPRDGRRGRPGPLLRHDGPGHVITVAPTRAGKGVGAVIPNLLDHPGPVVVTDPKGENFALTARFRADVLGHRVVALDPFGLAPDALFDRALTDHSRGSVSRGGLNPLDAIRPSSPTAADDAQMVAEMLVVGEGGGADNQFFQDEAKAVLSGLVLYVAIRTDRDVVDEDGVVEEGVDVDDRSLLAVRGLLTQDGEGLQATIKRMKGHRHELVKRAGNRLDQKHAKELSSVISTAQSHTHFLDSPQMTRVLGESSFDLAALRPGSGADGDPRPLSLYLLLPPDRLRAFSRWLRLTIATTITTLAKLGPLTGPAPPAHRRALLLLDEFAQLGPMPPVRDAVSLMAGYGVQVWPFLQDLSQLRRLYPKDWETFLANADVLQAFGTTDQGTAEYLSKMAGTATVFHHSRSSSRNRGKSASRSAGAGASETSRPLVTPDELRRLGPGDQVVIARGQRPVLARRIAYYADPTFEGRLKRAAAAHAKRTARPPGAAAV